MHLPAVYFGKMFDFPLHKQRGKLLLMQRDRSSTLLECGMETGRTRSSNSRNWHFYYFGKFLCPPFILFIMLKNTFLRFCSFYGHNALPWN